MRTEDTKKTKIKNLALSYFRNYEEQNFAPQSDIIVIAGANGIGKTNILEAISLLVPGRGFLNSKLEDISKHNSNCPWIIEAAITNDTYTQYIRTGYIKTSEISRRFIEIDGANISKQHELTKAVSVSWLIPQMDQIFITGATARRKLLDRIVSNFNSVYSEQLTVYEHYLKERANLLKNEKYDNDWIKIIEQKMAESAVIIAISRTQIVEMLQQTIDSFTYDFPKATLKMEGWLEEQVHKVPALQLEEDFKNTLKKNRTIDFLTKRTNAGIHRSDLLVYSKQKCIKAEKCSTGEQKSLLLSLFLAEVFTQIQWKRQMPIILLDDIAAHLDDEKQRLLSDVISDIGAQTWITGTDDKIFRVYKKDAEFITVKDNKVRIHEE